MTTVYVVNDSGHDFSAAEKYGKLKFLSSGHINRYNTNEMYRLFTARLEKSRPTDFILCTSLTQMNMIAAAIMARMHGRINLLIHHSKHGYIPRTVMLDKLLEVTNDGYYPSDTGNDPSTRGDY